MKVIKFNEENMKGFFNILCKGWLVDSSSKWSSENPSKGQYRVISLVVNDFLVVIY